MNKLGIRIFLGLLDSGITGPLQSLSPLFAKGNSKQEIEKNAKVISILSSKDTDEEKEKKIISYIEDNFPKTPESEKADLRNLVRYSSRSYGNIEERINGIERIANRYKKPLRRGDI
jgi:hypothetical protein